MDAVQAFNGIDVLHLVEGLPEAPLRHNHLHHGVEMLEPVLLKLWRAAMNFLDDPMNNFGIFQ